ncbi:MAG: hypothetical protein VX435_11545 [Planctomycetota bacterium]|nr:hypothetical protein [Planctomycetota bacterium]
MMSLSENRNGRPSAGDNWLSSQSDGALFRLELSSRYSSIPY